MDVKDPALLDDDPHARPQSLNKSKQALQDIVFGSAAGIVGKYIEYPFDTVKVRLQAQPEGVPLQYLGPVDCFRKSIKRDGFWSLYRGISAPLVGAAIETSSLFFSYRLAQNTLQTTIYDHQSALPLEALVVCGAASGAFTSLLLTPIELVKCKMQVPLPNAKGTLRYPGPLSIVSLHFKQQGLLGFWRGQLGTFIRETGGSAAWFGSYEGVTHWFRGRRARRQLTPVEQEAVTPLAVYHQLAAGATAGMSYNFAFYPADTIKSRMQTEDSSKLLGKGQRPTFWSVGKAIWADQGLKGLYKGCGITVARAAPSSAFIFTVYESLKIMFT